MVHMLEEAADQGHANAQYNLGVMFRHGRGVAQDYSAAMKWWRMAADQEYANAQVNLGNMYNKGQGVAQDYSAAMKWFRMAADQGDAKAQCSIGFMHFFGQGVPQNISEALRWLHKAQVQGDKIAKQVIELIMQAMRGTRASQQTNDSSMPPPSASPVPIGTRVELHGLKAKPQLNGQYGIVVDYVASSGRCTVALGSARGETETTMSIKPENLTWK